MIHELLYPWVWISPKQEFCKHHIKKKFIKLKLNWFLLKSALKRTIFKLIPHSPCQMVCLIAYSRCLTLWVSASYVGMKVFWVLCTGFAAFMFFSCIIQETWRISVEFPPPLQYCPVFHHSTEGFKNISCSKRLCRLTQSAHSVHQSVTHRLSWQQTTTLAEWYLKKMCKNCNILHSW